MIAFLNQCLKQCSNHSSYLMQAAHQISIIPLKANTINIPFHYSIFFSTAPLLEHLLLSLSSRTNLFRCFQNPVQTTSLGVKDSSSSPAMASLSEIPRVRYSLSPAIVREQPSMICLGPMGDPDPTDLINLETNRIPFKTANMNLDWSQTFRSSPSPTPGWRNWFCRMASLHQTHWHAYYIGQCITLSLSEMIRNEPILVSASYFFCQMR